MVSQYSFCAGARVSIAVRAALLHRLCATALALVLMSTFSSGFVFAQAVSQISGTVSDQSGAPIPNVRITVTQTDTGVARNTTTDSAGSFIVPDLPTGPYRVEAVGACVAKRGGLRQIVNTGDTSGQYGGSRNRIWYRGAVPSANVARKHSLRRAQLIVSLGDYLVVVFVHRRAGQNQPAWIVTCGQVAGNLERSRAEQGRIDLIVDRSQRGSPPALVHICSEVAGQHLGGRNEYLGLRRVGAGPRTLVSRKEEDLVLFDRTADRAAELVTLEGVPGRREEVPRVKIPIAEEFEAVTMHRIRAGLRYSVDLGSGV
jgi:Carboxypeptidase regulatory-like domain